MARQQRSRTKNNRFTDWANQGLKMAHWPVSRVARLGLLIGIGVAIAALYLLQSSEIVTASRHVQALRSELAQLRHANADLARREPTLRSITHKPIVPGEEEVANNSRARSAKLRVAEKL